MYRKGTEQRQKRYRQLVKNMSNVTKGGPKSFQMEPKPRTGAQDGSRERQDRVKMGKLGQIWVNMAELEPRWRQHGQDATHEPAWTDSCVYLEKILQVVYDLRSPEGCLR